MSDDDLVERVARAIEPHFDLYTPPEQRDLLEIGRRALASIEAAGYVVVPHERIDQLEEALHQIDSWSRAYPLRVFPEPDMKRVRELLKVGGITLDAVAASCMRRCVEGVGKIARDALSLRMEG